MKLPTSNRSVQLRNIKGFVLNRVQRWECKLENKDYFSHNPPNIYLHSQHYIRFHFYGTIKKYESKTDFTQGIFHRGNG